MLSTEARGRESMLDDTAVLFDGDTDIGIVDFVWKWARNGNPRDRNFTIVAEYFKRDEQGSIADAAPGSSPSGYDSSRTGYYLYGTYQFWPRWRVGARYDTYEAEPGLAAIPGIGPVGSNPDRLSFMVDFSNSEFSRLRLQLSDYDSGIGSSRALYLQYIMSMGSHGAHSF
jgi:hypothetical protein